MKLFLLSLLMLLCTPFINAESILKTKTLDEAEKNYLFVVVRDLNRVQFGEAEAVQPERSSSDAETLSPEAFTERMELQNVPARLRNFIRR